MIGVDRRNFKYICEVGKRSCYYCTQKIQGHLSHHKWKLWSWGDIARDVIIIYIALFLILRMSGDVQCCSETVNGKWRDHVDQTGENGENRKSVSVCLYCFVFSAFCLFVHFFFVINAPILNY
jgi:hypothetical protein